MTLTRTMAKKAELLMKEFPDLLEDKSAEKVKAELELEMKKSQEKLKLMAGGKKWDPKKGIELQK